MNVRCWCTEGPTVLVFDDTYFYMEGLTSTERFLNETGITVTPYAMNGSEGFSISTIVTNINNGTYFYCFESDSGSHRVYIYLENGRLTSSGGNVVCCKHSYMYLFV